ncbi:hypothetical protein Pelo_1543 [Pelomyxa schiedti]|nr:hypothetical protein Pelo_1543 [Pelomyxa schiedti]
MVVTDSTCFIWKGRFSNTHEQTFATNVATSGALNRASIVEVQEGEEQASFWAAIDGKSRYPTESHTRRIDSRLFQCSIGSGNFTVVSIIFNTSNAYPRWMKYCNFHKMILSEMTL